MRGASGGYVFLIILLIVAGALTFSPSHARAQACEALFSTVSANFKPPGRETNTALALERLARFGTWWVLEPELVEGLRSMAKWAPTAELLAVAEDLLSQRAFRRYAPEDQIQISALALESYDIL